MAMYFLFFVVGAHASERIRGVAGRSNWWIAAACTGVWLGVGLVDQFVDHNPESILKAVETVPGVVMVVSVAVCVGRWARAAALTWMGRHSLPVYVAHPVVLAAVVPALMITPLPHDGLPLVAAAVSVAVTYAVWWLLRRPAPWLFTVGPD